MRMRLVLVALLAACGNSSGDGPRDGGPSTPDACVGLGCQQVECPAGQATTLSGTVHAPNGTLPLYNVTVYVPNAPVGPLPTELACDRCSDALSGSPLVKTTTDTQGRFVLTDVPVGTDVPLVVQVGKWRRQLVVPSVGQCVDTPLAADDLRLPARQSEGDMPRIALSTGSADALECLLRKIGIADEEFTNPAGGGRVTLYAGDGDDSRGAGQYSGALGGAAFPEAETDLWANVDTLSAHDLVILSCEGGQNLGNKSGASRDALAAYADLGGRVFASHWHNGWIQHGRADFATLGDWIDETDLGDVNASVETSFERGADLAEWLVNVGASSVPGEIALQDAQHTLRDIDDDQAQRWIDLATTANNNQPSVQYFSFTAPLDQPADTRCGRVVFSDIHVSSASGDRSRAGTPFPNDCTSTELLAQEKVLAFMLFDISSCIDAPLE